MRALGILTALVTNGASDAQRAKIDRFSLSGHFDAILVEGEVGFGKPDPRAYALALSRLGVPPGEAWMVGDNLVWDVMAPLEAGIRRAFWIDARDEGLPQEARAPQVRVLRGVAELLPYLAADGPAGTDHGEEEG